jgi:hypothetical protein
MDTETVLRVRLGGKCLRFYDRVVGSRRGVGVCGCQLADAISVGIQIDVISHYRITAPRDEFVGFIDVDVPGVSDPVVVEVVIVTRAIGFGPAHRIGWAIIDHAIPIIVDTIGLIDLRRRPWPSYVICLTVTILVHASDSWHGIGSAPNPIAIIIYTGYPGLPVGTRMEVVVAAGLNVGSCPQLEHSVVTE